MRTKLLALFFILLFASSAFAANRIQIRRDTAAAWTATDPTLAQGEMGYETDTGKLKFGDGATAWTLLAYYSTSLGISWADANGAFVPYIGADYDLNMGAYSVKARGDSNFVNVQAVNFFGNGAGLTGVTATADVNGEDVKLHNVEVDGNLTVVGDSNFSNIGFTGLIFGNGSKLTGIGADINGSFCSLNDLNNFYYTKADVNAGWVPYVGAVKDLNLGAYSVKARADSNFVNVGVFGTSFVGDIVPRTANTFNIGNSGNRFLGVYAFGDFWSDDGVDSFRWDSTLGSLEMGQANIASGISSFAGGISSSATDDACLAFGQNATCAGVGAIALGNSVWAYEDYGVTLGNNLKNYNSGQVLVSDLNDTGKLRVYGDANFNGVQGTFFGNGSGLTGIDFGTELIRTYTGTSPVVIDNDANTIGLNKYIPSEVDIDLNAMAWDTNTQTACDNNAVATGAGACIDITNFWQDNLGSTPLVIPWADANVADNITVQWAGITGEPYIPNEQDIDLNAMAWDTNAQTTCDGNFVPTGGGDCIDITEFYKDTIGETTVDTTLDNNAAAQDYYWTNFGTTTTGADANVADDITLTNITQITNRAFTDLTSKNFSLLALDDNAQFDARYTNITLTDLNRIIDIRAIAKDTNFQTFSDFNKWYHSIVDLNNFYYTKADVNGNFASRLDLNNWYYTKTDVNTGWYGKNDINAGWVPFIGATKDVNIGAYALKAFGDSNFTNARFSGNSFLNTLFATGDSNFANIGFSGFIFGNGSKLTGISTITDTNFQTFSDFNNWYWGKFDSNGSFYGKQDINAGWYGKIDINAGFVPYIGAVYDANMGKYDLRAEDLNSINLGIVGNAHIQSRTYTAGLTSSVDLNVTNGTNYGVGIKADTNTIWIGNMKIDSNGTALILGG